MRHILGILFIQVYLNGNCSSFETPTSMENVAEFFETVGEESGITIVSKKVLNEAFNKGSMNEENCFVRVHLYGGCGGPNYLILLESNVIVHENVVQKRTVYREAYNDCWTIGVMNCTLNGNVSVGESCVHNQQCTRTPNARNCEGDTPNQRTCSCNEGFFKHNGTCLEGNVSLGGGRALKTRCSMNGTTCTENNNCFDLTQVGKMVGIAVVSTVLGMSLVLAIVVVLYRRRSKQSKSKINRPSVSNATYDRELCSTALQQQQTESASHSNVYPETEHPKVLKQGNTSEQKSSKDNIYNHLNEHHDEERDDNYDHAHPIHAFPVDNGDYTHLQIQ